MMIACECTKKCSVQAASSNKDSLEELASIIQDKFDIIKEYTSLSDQPQIKNRLERLAKCVGQHDFAKLLFICLPSSDIKDITNIVQQMEVQGLLSRLGEASSHANEIVQLQTRVKNVFKNFQVNAPSLN
jgi:hypothetical protein